MGSTDEYEHTWPIIIDKYNIRNNKDVQTCRFANKLHTSGGLRIFCALMVSSMPPSTCRVVLSFGEKRVCEEKTME
ncbi:unnamed protein product [Lupinus luteus]|uniref:Uncharacterized protein n=1 Tax=Lupinus luteus TaxID=3873 RepID=A0AAV1WX85_LUPLU